MEEEKLVTLASKLNDETSEVEKFKLLYEMRELINARLKKVSELEISAKLLDSFFENNLQRMQIPEDLDFDSYETGRDSVVGAIKEFLRSEGMIMESGNYIFINKGKGRIDFCNSNDWPYGDLLLFNGINEMFSNSAAMGPIFAKTLFKICGKEY